MLNQTQYYASENNEKMEGGGFGGNVQAQLVCICWSKMYILVMCKQRCDPRVRIWIYSIWIYSNVDILIGDFIVSIFDQ